MINDIKNRSLVFEIIYDLLHGYNSQEYDKVARVGVSSRIGPSSSELILICCRCLLISVFDTLFFMSFWK